MKFAKTIPVLLVAATALVAGSAAFSAFAQDAKTVAPIREVLVSQKGNRVAIRLDGGVDIEGTVAAVGVDTVLLTKLSGKDFYDSVLSISKINAVTYKARDK